MGALSYSVLTQLGLSPKATMLVMISVPALEALAFYLLLQHPGDEEVQRIVERKESQEDSAEKTEQILSPEEQPLVGFKEKLQYIPSLFKYIVPLLLVYVFEYFINQGLVSGDLQMISFQSICVFFCYFFSLN